MADLAVSAGPLALKNPVIAASSEATMDAAALAACLEAGAGAVVAKSVNESEAARRQLRAAEYVTLDDRHRVVEWPRGSVLFNRSGLADVALDAWLDVLEAADRRAREEGAWVLGSITVAAPEAAAEIAGRMSEAVRAVELNLGAPHGREAAGGAVRQLTAAEAVADYVAQARAVMRPGAVLVAKLGQGGDPVALAEAAVGAGADAVCLIGRYNAFVPDLETWDPVLGTAGAIGGGWALPLTCYWLARARRALPGVALIGTNGVRSGEDVARMLLSGASAAELGTAVFTDGPGALTRAVEELDRYCEAHGCAARDLVGASADRMRTYAEVEKK